MFQIVLANPKGGSGKTTTAMLLAEQIYHAGASVTVLDCDPNQNIVHWAKMREKDERPIPFDIITSPEEDELFGVLEALETDYVIIDLEGTASQLVTYAVSQADLVLIPFEPTAMETRQAARAIKLVESTSKMTNRNIPSALVFNRINAAFQTSDEKDVRRVTESQRVTALPVSLVKRAPYTRIFREAMLLSELYEQAAEEVKNSTLSQRERVLKPLQGAIVNAREFSQAVMNFLAMEEAA